MKKYLAVILFIVSVIVFSAFKCDNIWITTHFYKFTSTIPFQEGDAGTPLNIAGNWNTTPMTSIPAPCNGSVNLCTIQVITPTGKTPPGFTTVVNQLRNSYDAAGQSFILPIIVRADGSEQYRIASIYFHD